MEKNKIPKLSPNKTRKRTIATKILLAQRARDTVKKTRSEMLKTWQNAARVLKIMIFLHSAEDLPCILRLYGIEQEP